MAYVPFRLFSLLSVKNLYSILRTSFRSGFVFPGESHNFFEFDVILKGSAGITMGDKIFICREGEAVLQSPNVFHTMWVEEGDDCEIFTVSFDGTGIIGRLLSGKYLLTEDERRYVASLLSEMPSGFHGFTSDELTRPADREAISEEGYQFIKTYLELICLSLIRRGSEAMGRPVSDEKARSFAEIASYLVDNVERGLTLEEISKEVYESPAKIKALFRAYTGGGCMEYFNRLRCEHVIKLLGDGMTVRDIAEKMSFSSPYYLSYFFKRETGMTVREYRNLHIK